MWIGEKLKLSLEDILKYIKCEEHYQIVEHLVNGIWTDGPWKKCYYDVQSNVRKQVLNPFLFNQPYDNSVFNQWLHKAGYLLNGAACGDKFDQKELICIEIFDSFAKHIVRVLYTIKCISETCVKNQELYDSLRKKSEILLNFTNIEEAGKFLTDDFLYMTLMESLQLENDTKDISLLAYCVCFCMFFSNSTGEFDVALTVEQLGDIDISNLLFIDEKYEEVIQICNKILKPNRYNSTIYCKRAQAYLLIRELTKAKIDARRANILKPGWCEPYLMYTDAFELENNFHDAHLTATEGLAHCSDTKQCISREDLLKKVNYLKNQCPNCKPPDLLSSDDEAVMESSDIFSKTDSLNSFNGKSKTGSNFLLENKYINAIENFDIALQIVKTLNNQSFFVEEEKIISLKYALGVGHSHAFTDFENLTKALTCFEDIIKNQNQFPALFYMRGLVLLKLFRFEDALETLNYGLNIVNNIHVLTQYYWPGTNIVIDETIKENLKKKLSELISECHNAPKPDAKCRLESCIFTKNIYYFDPNFKGCYFLYCTGNCRVDYHAQCWKFIRDGKEMTEKDFLDKICLTPDCGNFFYLIEIIGKNGVKLRQLKSAVHVENKTVKHRKTKLEKKTEIRSIKKQKKQGKGKKALRDDESDGHESVNFRDDTEGLFKEGKPLVTSDQQIPSEAHESNLSSNTVIYEMDSKPAYIFKKEDSHDQENVDKKQGKSRDKKKAKKNVIGIDEFCRDATSESDNAYLERVQRLQLTKDFVECDIFCDNVESLNIVPEQPTKFEPHVTASPLKNLDKEPNVSKRNKLFQMNNIAELDNFTSSPQLPVSLHQLDNFSSPQIPVSLDQLDNFTDLPNPAYTNNKKRADALIVFSKENENDSSLILNEAENSLENQGTSKYNAYSLDSDNKILEQVRNKTIKLTNNFNAAAFQFQVTLLALTPDLQIQLVAGILNNFSNRPPEFWQRLNDILDVKFSIDGSLTPNEKVDNIPMVNKSLENELASVKEAYTNLQRVYKELEEDLTNLRDTNVKLHKTHTVFKNTKDQEVLDLLSKYDDLAKEKKDYCDAYEMEIKRVNFEKQKVEDDMKILAKDNESIGKYKERIEILMKSCEEKQSELERLKDAHEKLTVGSNVLIRQLDEMDIKTKKAMELLIEDRRLLGNMVLKSAIDKTHSMIVKLSTRMKTLNSNSPEYNRLEKQNMTQNQYFNNLVGIQGKFLRNMSECSKSLKNNEETFTFDEIPLVPSVPFCPESKPPGFFLPPTSTSNYLPNVQHQNSLPMTFSSGQTSVFPYLGQSSGLGDIFLNQGPTPSSASLVTNLQGLSTFNLDHGASSSSFDQPTHISISERTLSNFSSNRNVKSKASSPEILPMLEAGLKRMQVPAAVSNQNSGSSYNQHTPISFLETVPSTNSAKSQGSSPERSQVRIKSCYDKIVNLIQLKSPDLSEEEIVTYIKRYRSEKEKCSGKTNDEVARLVTKFIMEDRALASQKSIEFRKSKPILRDMSLPSISIPVSELPSAKMWKVSSKESGNFKSQDCSICFESLTNGMQLFQADCGHNCFHELCVRPWLKENSTCPICRTHLLLPDEFPEL